MGDSDNYSKNSNILYNFVIIQGTYYARNVYPMVCIPNE